MTQNRILIGLIVLLILIVFAVFFRGSCSVSAQTVEITPSTMPIEPGQPAAAPTVKVSPNPWTPEAVLMVIGAVATVLIPAIIALVKATRAERRAEENQERLDAQGETQRQQLLRERPPSGPHAV